MNRESIEQFVMRYLETTGCRIAEKGEGHVTVRLSPEADRDLMNRSYYWSFVERTGAPPEPMSFTFVFDPEYRSKTSAGASAAKAAAPPPGGNPEGAAPGFPPASGEARGQAAGGTGTVPPAGSAGEAGAPPGGDSILGRYFGVAPASHAGPGRVPSDVLTFGSRRLEQLFGVVQSRGRFVRMFEEPNPAELNPFASLGYATWLCVNYKLEFICDMKRDELHSLGINLSTGQITENFYDRIKRRRLTPQIPPVVHLQPAPIRLDTAVQALEDHLETMVKAYDHSWSEEAWKRLKEEWSRIDDYYGELLHTVEPSKKAEVEEQYRSREQEIDWQYRPRIIASVMNCGFFHLGEGVRTAIDASR